METETEKKYAKFQEKVKHSIYLDNLSPAVTEAVIRSAFEQYADVKRIQLIPNYTDPKQCSICALVEFDNEKQAEAVLDVVCSRPFMLSGMPRPVRGRPAQPEMFIDRPVIPGRTIQSRWLDLRDPDFKVAQRLKRLTEKHVAERTLLLKTQLAEEEILSKQQDQALKNHYNKYEMIGSPSVYGSSRRLAGHYRVNITDL